MGKILHRVSLKDVARAVGLHSSTVSLALRDDPRLNEKTRQRVKKAADRLGYCANPLVSAWLRQVRNPEVPSSGTGLAFFLGLSVSEKIAQESYYMTFVEGARAEAAHLGYNVLETFFGADDEARLMKVVQQLRYRGVRGVLVFDPGLALPPAVVEELLTGFAVVVMLRAKGGEIFHRVGVDIAANVELAMTHLRAAGYRRIGLPITPIRKSLDAVRKDVIAAYTLQQLLLPPGDRVPLPRKYIEHSQTMLPDWAKSQRADAILGVNINHHEFLADTGIVYAHFGVDTRPHLTGVVNRGVEIGREAVFKLAGMVTGNRFGKPEVPVLTLLPGKWRQGPVRETKNQTSAKK